MESIICVNGEPTLAEATLVSIPKVKVPGAGLIVNPPGVAIMSMT